MVTKPIIKSLLSQDLYKVSMGSVYFDKFANCTAKFKFKDRTDKIKADDVFMLKLNEQLDALCELKFTKDELDWLFNLRFLKNKTGYKEFLKNFQLDRSLMVDSYSGIKDNDGESYTGLHCLLNKKIDVVIAGYCFDFCVKATAIDCVEYCKSVTVIKGLSPSVDPSKDEETIKELEAKGVKVV